MDLNKLISKRIKEYALNGDAELLDKYGFLFNMIAKDYAEAINYTHCCKSDSELLHTKVFNLANELAKAGYGNEAVRMHHICNGM